MCDKPPQWCAGASQRNKPAVCSHPPAADGTSGAAVPGHWCTESITGKSGFHACVGAAPAGSEWPQGTCLADGDGLCPGHPHIKLKSQACEAVLSRARVAVAVPLASESGAAPPRPAPKLKPGQTPKQGATIAPYPTGPWRKRYVGSPPGTGRGRGPPAWAQSNSKTGRVQKVQRVQQAHALQRRIQKAQRGRGRGQGRGQGQ